MRAAFTKTLIALAQSDQRVILLTGDLGYMVLEPFAQQFPERFFNVGVAEQNMVGLATGLAEAGFVPFLYSIAPFAALRPYEFFRNGAVFQNLPLRLIGVGGGFDYGFAGPSHYALEDIALMRAQPGLKVISPADAFQAAAAIRATWDSPGPIYYRLGKDDRIVIPGLNGRFSVGLPEKIGEGNEVLLISTGSIALEAVKAKELLQERGITAAVLIVSTLNPIDSPRLLAGVRGYKLLITVEAHYINGGLGSLICELVSEAGLSTPVIRAGVRLPPSAVVGSSSYLQEQHGISAASIAELAASRFLKASA